MSIYHHTHFRQDALAQSCERQSTVETGAMSRMFVLPACSFDENDVPAPAGASSSKGKGEGKGSSGYHWRCNQQGEHEEGDMKGPAPVPDDDGVEHVLVHVLGISGEWLWSDVVHEYTNIFEVQRRFHTSNDGKFGLCNGQWYKLVWEYGRKGPYPPGSVRKQRQPLDLPCFALQDHVAGVAGILRSTETREVWITAIKVLVI